MSKTRKRRKADRQPDRRKRQRTPNKQDGTKKEPDRGPAIDWDAVIVKEPDRGPAIDAADLMEGMV